MTVARFFSGVHPISGELGIWMSKNGIDARSTVNPANFLLMPSRKFEQIVKAGEVYIPKFVEGQTYPYAYIPYDTVLTKYPYIFFQSSTGGSNIIQYPHGGDVNIPAYTNHVNRTLTINVQIWKDRIQIYNSMADQVGLYVQYFVLHRSVTG